MMQPPPVTLRGDGILVLRFDVSSCELKFLVPEARAGEVEDWARRHLAAGGAGPVTILHLDTPDFDILNRTPGWRRRRWRIRRSGDGGRFLLERKIHRGDRVRRTGVEVDAADVPRFLSGDAAEPWPGDWFKDEVALLGLHPACLVTCDRRTFLRERGGARVRVSLDRSMEASRADGFDVAPVRDGARFLAGAVVLKLEFEPALPADLRGLVADLALAPSAVSKYRHGMAACGAAPPEGRARA